MPCSLHALCSLPAALCSSQDCVVALSYTLDSQGALYCLARRCAILHAACCSMK